MTSARDLATRAPDLYAPAIIKTFGVTDPEDVPPAIAAANELFADKGGGWGRLVRRNATHEPRGRTAGSHNADLGAPQSRQSAHASRAGTDHRRGGT